MIFEWILDIVVFSWLFSLILPLWLGIILGIIIGGLFSYPYRLNYAMEYFTFTYAYYWLAFRKDKIMMSLLEEVK